MTDLDSMPPTLAEPVLLVTRDPTLLAWVQGCAAGHGVPVRAHTPSEVDAGWARSPLVLVGADVVPEVAAAGLPRREQIHLVGAELPSSQWPDALALGVRSLLDPAVSANALAHLLTAAADPRPPGVVVAIGSGSGGAGATTLGAACALVAGRDRSVAWLVPDPWVPDPSLLLGSEPVAGLHWDDLVAAGGRVSPSSLRDSVARHRQVALLAHAPPGEGGVRTPVPPGVLTGAVDAARAAFDLVLVDVDLRDPDQSREVLRGCDALWVVVRPRTAGLASARARTAWWGGGAPHTTVVVRGDGVPDLVVEHALGLPVLHRFADDRRLDEWIDVGAGPVPTRRAALRRAARDLVAHLDRSWVAQ